MVAGLVAEARESAAAAVAALEPLGDLLHLVEARMLLARALLAGGAYEEASCEAARAGPGVGRRPAAGGPGPLRGGPGRGGGAPGPGMPSPDLLRRSQRIAAELESQGWLVEALHVRTFVGRIALALGQPDVARAELAHAVGARTPGHGRPPGPGLARHRPAARGGG